MKNITHAEIITKRNQLESVISAALNKFLEETECEIELDVYRNESIGLRTVYVVKVKVQL
jgi:hypothetical protein